MNGIPFLLDECSYIHGLEQWICIDYEKSSHILWSGRTSSGKTTAAKLLLARTILLAPPDLQPVITIIDPKQDIDFNFLNGLPRFYRGEDAPEGFAKVFEDFRARQHGEDTSRNLKIVFVDEFSSLINLIDDRKEKGIVQKRLSLLLMLSRSFRFSVQMATQQPSAKIFGDSGSASREQFGAVCLLGDSRESETQHMLFDGDSRERIKAFGPIGGRGIGWLSINGNIAQPVRVPMIKDMDKLNTVIRNNLIGKGR